MDRLTTNKPVGEMTMTELAHNGCYVGENGWARYRDYDTDIDARDLARKLLERYEPEQPLPEENRALEEFLYDELQYSALDHAGALVALMYAMIWSMADLREHLNAYEGTGLEPGEIADLMISKATAETIVQQYEDAEEQGRTIVLPANWKELYDLRGDTVWVLWNGDPDIERNCPDGLEDLWEGVCCDVYIDEEGRARVCFSLHDYTDENGPLPFDVYASHYGEYIFRTKEEAEAVLEGCKND